MKKNEVMRWLRSRCEGKTQDFYLKSNRELWQELQLENLFKSFDEDGSNSLDVRELHDMFQMNGVDIKLEDCYELFKFVDEDGSGFLSIDEFKLFLKSEGANESTIFFHHYILVFRKIIRQEREKMNIEEIDELVDFQERNGELWKSISKQPRVPFNLNLMLEGMSLKNNRNRLIQQIDEVPPTINPEKTLFVLRRFLDLFKEELISTEKNVLSSIGKLPITEDHISKS
jgi:hypothetical protein